MRKIFVSVAKFLGLLDVAQCINGVASSSIIGRIERDIRNLENASGEALDLAEKQLVKAASLIPKAREVYKTKKDKADQKRTSEVCKLTAKCNKVKSKAYSDRLKADEKASKLRRNASDYIEGAQKAANVASKLGNLLK